MNCPMENRESAELLLAYSAGRMNAESTALMERHIGICPACREFTNGQRALWEVLEAWEGVPVSPHFDRRLYQRIEKEVSWWDLLIRPFRPMLAGPAQASVAAACVLILMAGAVLQRPPAARPVPKAESAQLDTVQPDQVEHALEAMQMLSDFSRQVRAAANETQM